MNLRKQMADEREQGAQHFGAKFLEAIWLPGDPPRLRWAGVALEVAHKGPGEHVAKMGDQEARARVVTAQYRNVPHLEVTIWHDDLLEDFSFVYEGDHLKLVGHGAGPAELLERGPPGSAAG